MGIRRSTLVAIFIVIGGVGLSASAQLFPFPSFDKPDKPKVRAERLPALRGDSKQVSASGISAGAFAATQLQVAYSSSLMGVGSVAGGPWYCAKGSLVGAYFDCMDLPANIDSHALVQEAKVQARKNRIDPLDGLKSARVYLYNSKQDSLVHEPMNEKTKEFFEAFVAKENIATETSIPSGHGFPTLDYGIDCGEKASPYLNKCGFDAAGEILKHLYANRSMARVNAVSSSLRTFDQTEFGAVGALMDRTGFVYIPEACRRSGAKCAVHVALHGCLQAAEEIGDVFVTHAGYNEWAEGSNIVVLYPQALKSSGNPNGCFDWWGYTGADYATRRGAQMKAIKAMIDRVL